MNSTISRTRKGFEGYNKLYTKASRTVYFQLVSLSETITEQDHVTNTLVSSLSCYLQEGSLLWMKIQQEITDFCDTSKLLKKKAKRIQGILM